MVCLRKTQDGYAVASGDGPGLYEVAFEALAGTEQQSLQPGSIAYIGTGTHPVAEAQSIRAEHCSALFYTKKERTQINC